MLLLFKIGALGLLAGILTTILGNAIDVDEVWAAGQITAVVAIVCFLASCVWWVVAL